MSLSLTSPQKQCTSRYQLYGTHTRLTIDNLPVGCYRHKNPLDAPEAFRAFVAGEIDRVYGKSTGHGFIAWGRAHGV
ncbi:MAG: hypothetical protein JXL81_11950 [Deltaproteobacteria bacterium]|nr:hypothetical protein [Deltaproteobacteria bacterium]